MKNRIIALFAVVVSLIAITMLTFTVLKRNAQGQREKPERIKELPQVVSKVKSLEIINTNLRAAETSDTAAVVKVRNNSDKPIIAIVIESGDDKNSSGTTFNGFNKGDAPPSLIVEPHGTFEMDIQLANVLPGFPIKISGVMYADGTEQGEEAALGTMRRQKQHHKNKREAEVPPQ